MDKPWEDEWGFEQWAQFARSKEHRFSRMSNGGWACAIEGTSYCQGATLDEAARESALEWCSANEGSLPWRERPDLSTVESCIRAITDAGGIVHLYGTGAEKPVAVWKTEGDPRYAFGKPREPWSLEVLQDAARYVLGIDAEEAKTDETRE